MYRALAESDLRNDRIFDDVLRALEDGYHPLVLTERRDHLERLALRFHSFVRMVIVFRGSMPARERAAALTTLRSADPVERLVLATGRYLGEGFDCARLDTLFLTLPISWKGTLAQYVGRLHREHIDKHDVLVVDYVELGARLTTNARRIAALIPSCAYHCITSKDIARMLPIHRGDEFAAIEIFQRYDCGSQIRPRKRHLTPELQAEPHRLDARTMLQQFF